MKTRALIVAIVVTVLFSLSARAEIPPPFTVSASAAPAPGTPIQGPGCPATGSWQILGTPLADGSYYVFISQVNILPPSSREVYHPLCRRWHRITVDAHAGARCGALVYVGWLTCDGRVLHVYDLVRVA
jgi:hypothetical protein